MVDHIVLFRFRPDLPAGTLEALFQDLRGLMAEVPGITSFRGGAYSSPEGLNGGFTHGMVMTFVDASARDAYLPHPAHQRVVQRLLPLLRGGLGEGGGGVRFQRRRALRPAAAITTGRG